MTVNEFKQKIDTARRYGYSLTLNDISTADEEAYANRGGPDNLRIAQINIVDPKTGEAIEAIYVLTCAEGVLFSDGKDLVEKIYEITHYTNTALTPADIGGIPAGSNFVDADIKDILTRILYRYVPPTVEFMYIKGMDAINYRMAGTTPQHVDFRINVVKGSSDVGKVMLFKNGEKVAEMTTEGQSKIVEYTYETPFTDNSTFTVQVTDSSGKTIDGTNTVQYIFNYPVYICTVPEADEVLQEVFDNISPQYEYDPDAEVLRFSALVSPTEECIVVAFHEFNVANTKVQVLDTSGFDITNSCDLVETEFVFGGIRVPYKYYKSNATTQQDFKITLNCELID